MKKIFRFVSHRFSRNFFAPAELKKLELEITRLYELEAGAERDTLMLAFSAREKNLTLHVIGNLERPAIANFKTSLGAFLESDFQSFTFDLAAIGDLDSAGIAALIEVQQGLVEAGKQARMTRVSQKICRQLFSVRLGQIPLMRQNSYPLSLN